MVDKNRSTSGLASGLDISPAVPDKKTAGEVDVPISRCVKQQPRFRLAAVAAIPIVVVAYPNIIERDLPAQVVISLLNGFAGEAPSGHLRLIRNHEQNKALLLQSFARLGNTERYLDFVRPGRRVWAPVPHNSRGQDAVAIEKHRPALHLWELQRVSSLLRVLVEHPDGFE
jgi:hypothetical protein